MPTAVKILLAILAVVAGLVLILVIAARLAGYDTTMDLVRYLISYLQYIWNERLFA